MIDTYIKLILRIFRYHHDINKKYYYFFLLYSLWASTRVIHIDEVYSFSFTSPLYNSLPSIPLKYKYSTALITPHIPNTQLYYNPNFSQLSTPAKSLNIWGEWSTLFIMSFFSSLFIFLFCLSIHLCSARHFGVLFHKGSATQIPFSSKVGAIYIS